MARCTAPVQGHRTASGRANCPACGSRGSYGYYSRSPSYQPAYRQRSAGVVGTVASRSRSARPRWSRAGSSVTYSAAEVNALNPVRRSIEVRAALPELLDVFLCHAWDDRTGVAKQLHELLEAAGVTVWFSEKQVVLGTPLLRAIDKGLARTRAGVVLVTPSLLTRLSNEGIADKELSELLARDQLIPVVHGTTFEALREISPLLASRSGLSTADQSLADVAAKVAELVDLSAL